MLPKTRLAPTPSGYLHSGNLFSFALTWLLARKEGLRILLRIDDMDRARFRPEYLEDIFRSLDSLGIDYDEGPDGPDEFEREWSQRMRLDLYHSALNELKEKDALFACTCSRKEILNSNPEGIYLGKCLNKNLPWESPKTAWRWRRSKAQLSLKDWQGKEENFELPAEMAHMVLRTKAGYPAYQISSLIDDIHFQISHIARGEDLAPSSLAQLAIAEELKKDDFGKVHFLHHPLLLQKGKKLSKSKDAPAARVYADKTARENLIQQLGDYLHLPKGAQTLQELLQAIRTD